jgi:hypothetical protein
MGLVDATDPASITMFVVLERAALECEAVANEVQGNGLFAAEERRIAHACAARVRALLA